MASNELSGIGVLVTRPIGQSEALCTLVQQHGGKAWRFPVLVIQDIDDTMALDDILDTLGTMDMAIFVSVNAVEKGLQQLQRRQLSLAATTTVACIGPSSAEALQQAGMTVDVVPEHRFDSEGLLALEAMQHVDKKNIVIFRGQGGRPTLGETLSKRGARVVYAECYSRSMPDIDAGPVIEALKNNEIDIGMASSAEGLHNLIQMMGNQGMDTLKAMPIVVPSQRVADEAHKAGFHYPAIVAANAGDIAVLEAIQLWHRQQKAL